MKVELRMVRIAVLVCIVSVCGFAVPARAHVCYPPCNSSECKSCSADNTCELDCDDWDKCEDCVDGNCVPECTGCETCDNSFCEDDESKCPGECERCSDGDCTNYETLCFECEDCDSNGECVDDGVTCEGCKTCNDAGNCEDDNNAPECNSETCDKCVGGTCVPGGLCTTGQCCDGGACVTTCPECKSCSSGVCEDDTVASVTSNKDGACVGCSITFTATTDPTGLEDDVSWSGGGNPTTGTGATFSTTWDTTGTKTVTASLCESSVSKQVTIAAPTNFRETYREVRPNGVLYFEYTWDSTSGNVAHLVGCKVGEKTDYPGGNPYYWPSPPWTGSSQNPTVEEGDATAGFGTDTHSSKPFITPYQGASSTATQIYRYSPCVGNYTTLMGPISIYRIVSGEDELWRYSIIKSGAYAEIFPLP